MSTSTVRWCGLAAMLGGALSVVAAVVFASLPRGCIGDEYRPMRDAVIAGAMLMLALLLVMVRAVGLVIRARNAGRFGGFGIASVVVVGAVAATLLAIGTVLNTQDSSFVPMFIIPGLLALIVGFVLLGVAELRARVLPRWTAFVLIVGSLTVASARP